MNEVGEIGVARDGTMPQITAFTDECLPLTACGAQ